MAQEKKQLLIVDDTKIDRIVLKSILSTEFEILEASSGNMAFEYITTRRDQLDAIMLDLSMPHIDGFDVLKFMQEKGIDDIPVFVVTSESTADNIEKAVKYHIDDFIVKPLDKDDVLSRLRSRLGEIPSYDITKEDMTETMKYISDLEAVYQTYLKNFGKKDKHYKTMVDLMRILLTDYSKSSNKLKLNADKIELISKAAYFCDIGEMLIPDRQLQLMTGHIIGEKTPQLHTTYGFNLLRLNRSPQCRFFVEICSNMCLHHHERWDGTGYPHGIRGKNNSIFNQLCRLVDEFDQKRSAFYGGNGSGNSKPIKFIIRRLVNDDSGMVSKEVYDILDNCKALIVSYFMKQDV